LKLTHVEAAILAGGASRRMGRDKASLEWGGVPMARRVAGAVGACVERVRIVLRRDLPNPTELERIDDVHGARAPIVGVHAALRACEASAVLVASCDIPELDPRVVLALLALVPAEGGADVVAPRTRSGPEPLLAVYRPRILPAVERRIDEGALALHGLLDALETLFIPEDELRALDPRLRSLRNVNRPSDLPAQSRR
jgi:molybdopterin-guanine dinucleotide biosynthesis protein A